MVSGREAPEWVSADLITRNGTLRDELFTPDERRLVEMHLETGRTALERYLAAQPDERPPDPCVYVASPDGRLRSSERTLQGLASSSSGIYLGTVLEQRPGLLRGVPRALSRVRVETALKHEGSGPSPGSLLVAYPEVKLEVDGVCIAAKSPRHPERPQTGRQILVFSKAEVPLGAGGVILTPDDEEIFFELPDGSASLPAHFGDLSSAAGEPVPFDLVVEQTAEAVRTAGEGAP